MLLHRDSDPITGKVLSIDLHKTIKTQTNKYFLLFACLHALDLYIIFTTCICRETQNRRKNMQP